MRHPDPSVPLGVLAMLACALAACADAPTRPYDRAGDGAALAPAATVERFVCTVVPAERRTDCRAASGAGGEGVLADRVIGGQDWHVLLTTTSWAYDAGTEQLTNAVTVQNLVQTDLGTPNGSTVAGVDVFLATGPEVVVGTGTVTVANADGTRNFTAPNQPYFHYPEILEPYQISAPRNWVFNVPPTVASFRFTAYVSAPMPDEDAPLLDAVWTGATSTVWSVAGNWVPSVVPGAGSVVSIPSDPLLTTHRYPVLSADASTGSLRVGTGSSLGLASHGLTVDGNLDAPGEISGGTITLTGADRRLGGTLPALVISAGARLQRPTEASGPVSITGSLSIPGVPLSIAIP